jgi:hypothetical protein
MCFVRISEQTATFALKNIKRLVLITEVESVYSAVRTEFLYKTDRLRLKTVNSETRGCINDSPSICSVERMASEG